MAHKPYIYRLLQWGQARFLYEDSDYFLRHCALCQRDFYGITDTTCILFPCQAISLSQMADSIQGLLPHQSCTQPMSNHTTLYTVFYIKQMQLGCKYNE